MQIFSHRCAMELFMAFAFRFFFCYKIRFLSRKPSWWKQRTTLEKLLTVITILALIAMTALAISLASVILKEKLQTDIRMIFRILVLSNLRHCHFLFSFRRNTTQNYSWETITREFTICSSTIWGKGWNTENMHNPRLCSCRCLCYGFIRLVYPTMRRFFPICLWKFY